MKKYFPIILIALFGFAGTASALQYFTSSPTLIPNTANNDLGTTTAITGQGSKWRTLYVNTASTTNLTISGINGSTQCLTISSTGVVTGTGGACAASSFPFTPATNFAVNTNSTTTPIWLQSPVSGSISLMASSTAAFDKLTVASTTATSTFSTGGLTVGTSQFVVQQTSGRVGIGMTNPGGSLDVGVGNPGTAYAAFTAAIHTAGATSGDTLVLSNSVAGGFNRKASIQLRGTTNADGHDNSSSHIISGVTGSNQSTSYITIGSASAADTYRDELTITAGNVGIGTSTPNNLLSLVQAGSNTAGNGAFYIGNSGSSAQAFDMRIDGTNNDLQFDRSFGASWSNFLTFQRSSGNIGIGTSTPQALLHIGNPAVANANGAETLRISTFTSGAIPGSGPYINFTDYNNLSLAQIRGYRESTGVGGLSFSTEPSSGTITEAMHITGAGNVGIGSTSPSAKFSVHLNALDTIPASLWAFAIGSSTASATTTLFSIGNTGAQGVGGATTTISSCGAGTPSVTGNDTAGVIYVTNATTLCTVNWAKPKTAPRGYSCNISANAAVAPYISATSTTGITFGFNSSNPTLYYTGCQEIL